MADSKKPSKKKGGKAFKLTTENITTILGFVITISLSFAFFRYTEYTKQFEAFRKPSAFFSFLQDMSHRYNDLKYRFRGATPTEAPVALVAIDDESLREVGRWPWSRELIAQLIDNSLSQGAKSIGFDVMFSEPERGNPEADLKFKAVIEKYPQQIVLGTSSENQYPFLVYQDYCVTEAFLATQGDQIVKLNPSLIVDDVSGVFDNLNWGNLFKTIFFNQKQIIQIQVLRELKKSSVEELTQFQKNYLESKQSQGLFEYCKNWLTKDDFFLAPDMKKQIAPLYEELFSSEPSLKQIGWEASLTKLKNETPLHPIPQYGEWTGNIPELQTAATYTASFIAQQDPDGPVRRYPLFFRSGNRLGSSFIPSLALQTYLLAKGYRADVKIERPNANSPKKEITQFRIVDPNQEPEKTVMDLPVDNQGQVIINYYGGQTSLPYISARELLNDSDKLSVMRQVPVAGTSQILIKTEEKSKKEFLKDRALLVGASALALYDLRTVPLQANYPGPEIHLTMLANLMDQKFLRMNPNERNIILIVMLVLGFLSSVVWSYAGALPSILFATATMAATVALDFYYFLRWGVVASGIFVLLLLVINYLGLTAVRYFFEEKKKKEIKSTFSKYVSPKVVDELLKSEDNLKLGGRKQVMTVFFSDVRGFTTISEKLSPEALSNVLNRYLTPMTELVFKNHGTLDKYMGDAMMAFFGAPIETPDHPKQACQCALDNLAKLKEIQEQFAKEGLPFIDVGIGINTGEMSVGNMGSNIVQNYTVMGDSVNLASRLEGINKTYGTKIIISEFTQKAVKDDFVTREVDRVQVKGKNEPVRIFELVARGKPTEENSAWLKEFETGYGLYMQKQFETAISHFENVIKLRQQDPVSDLYIERCRDFIAEPPPESWDGVYVSKTK